MVKCARYCTKGFANINSQQPREARHHLHFIDEEKGGSENPHDRIGIWTKFSISLPMNSNPLFNGNTGILIEIVEFSKVTVWLRRSYYNVIKIKPDTTTLKGYYIITFCVQKCFLYQLANDSWNFSIKECWMPFRKGKGWLGFIPCFESRLLEFMSCFPLWYPIERWFGYNGGEESP